MDIEDIKKDGRLEGYLRDQLNFMAKDCIKNPLLAPTLIDMTVKYIKEFIFLIYTSKTSVSEEIKDTLPQVDIVKEDVNKTDEKLTCNEVLMGNGSRINFKGQGGEKLQGVEPTYKINDVEVPMQEVFDKTTKERQETMKRSTMSDTENILPDNEETVLDAEDQEYLQEWLQQKLSHYGLTLNQREKFALKIMNIFKPYLRTYTGTTQVATQVKQNIERNALIEFKNWCKQNDRYAEYDIDEYLKEKEIK